MAGKEASAPTEPTTNTEVAQGGEPTEPTQAEAVEAKPEVHGLSLDELLPGNDNAEGDEKTESKESEPANDNAETVDPNKLTEEQVFSSEALATPEGLGRAREI